MMVVCLVVLTIIGASCEVAPLRDDCLTQIFQPTQVYCVVNYDQLLVRPSWYDPFIQTDKPHVAKLQCQEPCEFLGDFTPVVSSYGLYMACPLGWYGRWVEIENVGARQCRDHGGAIKPTYGRTYSSKYGFYTGWWIAVDELAKERPFYAFDLLNWRFVESEVSDVDEDEMVYAIELH